MCSQCESYKGFCPLFGGICPVYVRRERTTRWIVCGVAAIIVIVMFIVL
ncbi:MAG: hypothetical protein J6Y20_04525 [Lachnospiraceae bacterium]|nr:hypothetical protein [Lachnospiraceae bacterium]